MRNKLTFIALLIISLLFIGVGAALAQEGDPDRGAQIYAQNCAVCHGPEAKGRIGINLSQDFPSINVDAFLKQNITSGVSGTRMPAWGQANGGPLSEQEIADVAAYVAGLTGGSEPVAPAPTFIPPAITPAAGVTGDEAAGAKVFAENCVMCHGDHGQGRIGALLQKDWPSINPSAYIRQTVENGVEKTLMPAWLDTNGGPLTATDIDNVSAFIVSLSQTGSGNAPPATPAAAAGPINFTAGLLLLAVLVVIVIAVGVIYYRRA